jgi:PHD/YefM family antitoxin component YafN of YafNO toxin-antitoxin module
MDRDTDRWVRSDEARAKLRDLLDEIGRDEGAYIYVLRYDKPAAVLVSPEWFESVRAALERGEAAPEGLRAVSSADPLERVMKRLAGMPEEGGRK